MRSIICTAVLAAGLVAGSAGASLAGPTASAASAGNLTAPNWSGYYARVTSTPILAVTAEFRVPQVFCSQGWGLYPRAVSFWVGIGGLPSIDGKKVRLEQAGLDVYCDQPWSKPKYWPFWEVAPNDSEGQFWHDSHGNAVTVQPGDLLEAYVERPGQDPDHQGEWGFGIGDLTAGGTFWTAWYKLPAGENPGTTAEAITEWPDTTSHLHFGTQGGLADAGTVSYTDADFYTATAQMANAGGDVWPVTEHTITLKHNGKTVLYPGTAGQNPWPSDYDGFTTQYTGKF